jgi:nitrate reductase beta subunit
MTEESMYEMYRLLAIAKYDERYVIPPAHAEQAHALEELATECSVDFDAAGSYYDQALLGEGAGYPTPGGGGELPDAPGPADLRHHRDELAGGGSKAGRVNLLNWDGRGTPTGLFPPPADKQNGDR